MSVDVSKLTVPRPFPRVYCDGATIFVFNRQDVTAVLLRELLESINGVGDYERHVSLLEARLSGELDLRRTAKMLGLPSNIFGLSFYELPLCYGLPTYRLGEGHDAFEWTLDVFNPNNSESFLQGHSDAYVYLNLAIPRSGFKPITDAFGANADRVARKQSLLNLVLRCVWQRFRPLFVFGSADFHLVSLMLVHNFSRLERSRFPLSLEPILWPWAIYRHETVSALKLLFPSNETSLCFPPEAHDEGRGVWFEHLEGGVLLFSQRNLPEDEKLYSKLTGLKSLFAAPRPSYPGDLGEW